MKLQSIIFGIATLGLISALGLAIYYYIQPIIIDSCSRNITIREVYNGKSYLIEPSPNNGEVQIMQSVNKVLFPSITLTPNKIWLYTLPEDTIDYTKYQDGDVLCMPIAISLDNNAFIILNSINKTECTSSFIFNGKPVITLLM